LSHHHYTAKTKKEVDSATEKEKKKLRIILDRKNHKGYK
jgi:hypothetical protein